MPYPPKELMSISKGKIVTGSQLPKIVGLSDAELRALIEADIFPPARCNLGVPCWNAKKVAAWKWGLENSKRLADQVAFVLGRRDKNWSE